MIEEQVNNPVDILSRMILAAVWDSRKRYRNLDRYPIGYFITTSSKEDREVLQTLKSEDISPEKAQRYLAELGTDDYYDRKYHSETLQKFDKTMKTKVG